MRKLLTLFAFILCTQSSNAQTLIGSWPFNGNANDVSGNSLNGSVYNATLTAGQGGVPNTAYQFNGINSHIDVPYSPLLNLTVWTIKTNVRIDGFNSSPCQEQVIVGRGTAFTGDWFDVGLNDNSHDHDCYTYSPNYNNFLASAAGIANVGYHDANYIIAHQWYCMAATFDGNWSKTYINGIAIDSAHYGNQYSYGGSQPPLVFGYYPAGGFSYPYWLNGAIDNLSIWSGLLVNPSINLTKHRDTICAGGSVAINAAGTGGFLWYPAAGLNTITSGNVIASPSATTTYYVTSTGLSCDTLIDSVTVVVLPSPATPVVSSNSPICNGNTIALSGSPVATGVSYHWTGPLGFSSNLQNPSITNATVSSSGVYSLYTILNGCNSATATTSVIVNPIPLAPATASITYCQFDNAALLTASGAPNSTLQWYTQQTGGTASLTLSPTTNTAGSTTYYVSQIVNGCEGPRAPLTVIVNAKPPVPIGISTYSYCQFDTVQQLSVAGQSLLWYPTPTGGVGSTATPALSSALPGTFNYYVSQTVNGCISDRLQITETVIAKPQPPVVADTSYCIGNPILVLSATGQNIKWYISDTTKTGTLVAPTYSSITVQGQYVWYVSQTINGCESNRAIIHVEADKIPVAAISAPAVTKLCQGDTISFFYNSTLVPGNTFSWTLPTGAVLVSGSLQSVGPLVVRLNTKGANMVSLRVTNKKCSSATTISVNTLPAPSASVNLKNDVCVDESLTINVANKINVDNYTLDLGGGSLLFADTSADTYRAVWRNAGVYVVTINLAGSATSVCTNGILYDTVNVHATPIAAIQPLASILVCAGDLVPLKAESASVANIYKWLPKNMFGAGNLGAEITASVDVSSEIVLKVTSPFGCMNEDSVFVTTQPCCEVYFPNAFTPNNDGKNDVFRPVTAGNHKLNAFRILNRYGQVVYETRDERKGWDGKFDGIDQEVGTYFFLMKYKCADGKDYTKKGAFVLIR